MAEAQGDLRRIEIGPPQLGAVLLGVADQAVGKRRADGDPLVQREGQPHGEERHRRGHELIGKAWAGA